MNNMLEFAKGTSSCFFVMSPFQLLCALEAIDEFEIKDYKLVFVLLDVPEFAHRNDQMREMAHHMHLKYEECDFMQISYDEFFERKGLFASPKTNKYDRLFIGDYYATPLLMISSLYASKSALLLYTDDGNSSISIIQGKPRDNRPMGWMRQWIWYRDEYKVQQRIRTRVQNVLLERGIKCTQGFFTLYNDLPSKDFVLYPNRLCHLSNRVPKESPDKPVVVIVGAAIAAYAKQNRIPETELESIVNAQLSNVSLQHPDREILYVPHGRDTNLNVRQYCETLHFVYQKIEEPIEYYLLRNGLQPDYVYGFNSTALLNLKRLFPSANVSNCFIEKRYDNSYYNFFSAVRLYYEQNGIHTIIIKYPNPAISKVIKKLLVNQYIVAKYFLKKILRKLHILK